MDATQILDYVDNSLSTVRALTKENQVLQLRVRDLGKLATDRLELQKLASDQRVRLTDALDRLERHGVIAPAARAKLAKELERPDGLYNLVDALTEVAISAPSQGSPVTAGKLASDGYDPDGWLGAQ